MDNLDIAMRGGELRKEYMIECATCAFWESYDLRSMKEVEKLARIEGWSETEKFGWICPDCKTKDRDDLAFWKSTLEIDMVTVDVKCICGKHGEGVVVHKQEKTYGEAVGVAMPRGWGFYIPEPERTIVPLCEHCKGTKGDVAYPTQSMIEQQKIEKEDTQEHIPECKLPGG